MVVRSFQSPRKLARRLRTSAYVLRGACFALRLVASPHGGLRRLGAFFSRDAAPGRQRPRVSSLTRTRDGRVNCRRITKCDVAWVIRKELWTVDRAVAVTSEPPRNVAVPACSSGGSVARSTHGKIHAAAELAGARDRGRLSRKSRYVTSYGDS